MSEIINTPKFIVVEGMDGSGKTTIVEHIAKRILDAGYIYTKGRGLGSSKVAETIREQMFSKKPTSNYEIFAALMCLIDCHENFVTPTLTPSSNNEKNILVLDRYIPSYFAYQVAGRESELAEIMLKEAFDSSSKPTPDLYIYIEVDIDVALSRTKNRGDSNYLDEEVLSYRKRVHKGYSDYFDSAMYSLDNQYYEDRSKAPKVIRLNGNNSLNDVLDELHSKLSEFSL